MKEADTLGGRTARALTALLEAAARTPSKVQGAGTQAPMAVAEAPTTRRLPLGETAAAAAVVVTLIVWTVLKTLVEERAAVTEEEEAAEAAAPAEALIPAGKEGPAGTRA